MDALLNLSTEGPFNVGLLDQVVNALYSTSNIVQHEEAKAILVRFQEHPDAWARVPEILMTSNSAATKFLALQILDRLINTRWTITPPDQRQGIRNFLVQTTVSVASDDATLRRDRAFVNKLNGTLVQVLKHEWPDNWPMFIPELIESSKTNEALCENNMHILRLLSEDIYEFSLDRLTHAKAVKLKEQLETEFSTVLGLCLQTLQESTKPSLVKSTLEALARFLTWIPLKYVVETDILDLLLNKFMASREFRNIGILCLSEIAKKPFEGEYEAKTVFILTSFIEQLSSIIPSNTRIAAIYEESDDSGQQLVFNTTLFLAHFLSSHIAVIESARDTSHVLLEAHRYLLQISRIDDRELFKLCIEYWHSFLTALYEETLLLPVEAFTLDPEGDFDVSLFSSVTLRKDNYLSVLSDLRITFIERMAKPNEVLVVENEDGELVREELKDNDTSALHQSMRQLLTYLTHLDKKNTTDILRSKLSQQVDGTHWSWQSLNSLCWAIGSISGTMDEAEERAFLHVVLRELLGLAERRRDKDDKVVIASNIMYVVGQYPRFLNRHWGFLKVVSVKLFEFMHESHEGVKDMACDTFMTIAQRCKRPFVTIQAKEKEPFMLEILRSLPVITKDLTPQQYNIVSQAGAYIISAEPEASKKEVMIGQLMGVSNQAWDMLMAQAAQDLDVLDDDHNVKVFANVLRSNTAACLALGQAFLSQLGHMFSDMLGLYRAVSITINDIVSSHDINSHHQSLRDLKPVRKEILILIGTFVSRAEDLDTIRHRLTPPLLDIILDDYRAGAPQAREAEVLRVLDILFTKLESSMALNIERIFTAIFDSTLALITEDFVEFPDHRINFFRLLRSTNRHCFSGLTSLPTQAFELYMQSVFWAIKHTTPEVSETGLSITLEVIMNFSEEGSTTFFENFLVPIVQETLAVLTDSDHRSGLQLQALILSRIFHMAKSGIITTLSAERLQQTCNEMLHAAFPSVHSAHIEAFTGALETQSHDLARLEVFVRDFLIEVREVSAT